LFNSFDPEIYERESLGGIQRQRSKNLFIILFIHIRSIWLLLSNTQRYITHHKTVHRKGEQVDGVKTMAKAR